jgi:hypothetical protein
MTAVNNDHTSAATEADPAASDDRDDSVTVLAVVSIAISGLGFLTLLRLADRRDRTPARTLGLFFVTWFETISGTVLGLVAASRASDSEAPGTGLLLGASGAVLGIVTAVLNFNWMRTRRRL